MENATKALIIAGAILISILLISVGIIVYQSATGVIEEGGTQMDAEQIRMFNEKFTSSAGSKVKATTVRNVVNNIITSNATNETNKIVLDLNGTTYENEKVSDALGEINTRFTYTIKTETSTAGVVTKVIITKE